MTATQRQSVIGWKVASLAFSMASVRYRAMLPLMALEHSGLNCRVFSDATCARLEELDLLVIVKSFSIDDYLLAQQAVARGVPVVLDLCDNIFIDTYGVSSIELKTSPAQMFLAMAPLAKAIVVTTEPLAQIVRSRLGGKVPVHVIPDGLESRDLLEQMRGRLALALQSERKSFFHKSRQRAIRLVRRVRILRTVALGRLTRRLVKRARKEMHWKRWVKRAYRNFDKLRTVVKAAAHKKSAPSTGPIRQASVQRPFDPNVKRILWFGNHGAAHARFGMLDLLEIRDALETIAMEFKVELVVVSNHRDKYERHILPFKIPSSYVEWSPAAIKQQLSLASVVVVPNTLDAFSLCKSANRTATALSAGVPVVATATPALDTLGPCLVLDDFLAGLRLYLGDGERAAADVARGKETIAREFGQGAIAAAWSGVIDHVRSIQASPPPPDAELVVALNLTQDLDLALPIILQAMHAGISVVACCNKTLVRKSPRLAAAPYEYGMALSLLPEDFYRNRNFKLPPSVKMLLTVTESNLAPHMFTRKLTDAANAQNLFTATLQHGFENIGLTYDDELQSADKIDFAAQRIYLWGAMETLHPKVRMATRRKCVPMGCPKPARVPKADLGNMLPLGMPVIGVFENLHWTRYSDDYRSFFIENVQRLAHLFPDVLFLVKPHHAGLWLTARFKGEVPQADNILIADPQSPAWEPFTAPSLMGHFQAIITSPSTVALDGARQHLPLAVVAHELSLPNYAPLTLIHTQPDWGDFVRKALDPDSRGALVARAHAFVDRTLLPDGAAERIVKDMLARVSVARKEAAHG